MTQQTKVPVVAVVLAAGSGVRFDPQSQNSWWH